MRQDVTQYMYFKPWTIHTTWTGLNETRCYTVHVFQNLHNPHHLDRTEWDKMLYNTHLSKPEQSTQPQERSNMAQGCKQIHIPKPQKIVFFSLSQWMPTVLFRPNKTGVQLRNYYYRLSYCFLVTHILTGKSKQVNMQPNAGEYPNKHIHFRNCPMSACTLPEIQHMPQDLHPWWQAVW